MTRGAAAGKFGGPCGRFVSSATVALILGGAVTGLILVIAWSVRREDRRLSLAVEDPDPVSGMARRMNGLRRRDLSTEFLHPVR